MESDTNKGITKPCPECKKILLSSADMAGYGEFKQNIKCAYCGTLVRVEVTTKPKTYITITKVLGLITLIGLCAWQVILSLGINSKFTYLITTYGFHFPK